MARPVFRGPWKLVVIARPTPTGDDTIYELEWQRWLASGFCRFGPTIPAKRVNGRVVPA